MSERHIAYAVLRDLYGIDARTAEPLDQYVFAWRTIVRSADTGGQTWLLRLLALPDAPRAMRDTARVLEWLRQREYPAPRIRTTISGSPVGQYDTWSTMLLTFVPGSVVARDPASLARFATQLGRLHALGLPANADLPHSRCHPDQLAATAHSLAAKGYRLPADLQPIAATLYAAAQRLQVFAPGALTHGDCWYANAIDYNSQITLIDWDCAGIGIAILDLGNLLITSHFDLAHPLELYVEEHVVQYLVEAYQRTRPLLPEERRLLGDAAFFLIAFQLGSYLDDHDTIDRDDFVLRKLIARFEASRQIAHAIHNLGPAWRSSE